MPRKKGTPKTGGRKKGTPNKSTVELQGQAAQTYSQLLADLVKQAAKGELDTDQKIALLKIIQGVVVPKKQEIALEKDTISSIKQNTIDTIEKINSLF